jgi:hypothetical protein
MTASPHRLADVAARLVDHLDAHHPDATARWLCGELPDPLDRWTFMFFLARLAIEPGESAASVLQRRLRQTTGRPR